MTTWARITEKEVAQLREKVRAHDVVQEAMREMAGRMIEHQPYRQGGKVFYDDGWLDCMAEFSLAVARIEAAQSDPSPGRQQLQPDLPF